MIFSKFVEVKLAHEASVVAVPKVARKDIALEIL